MPHINWTRVLLGGVIAGVVIDGAEAILNTLILRAQWARAMEALGRPAQMTAAQIVAYSLWGVLVGIFATWLYAAIRPRYGPGPRTALWAGAAVWFLGYALSAVPAVVTGLFSARLMSATIAWGLPEILIATLAGAWIYREVEAAPQQRVSATGS